jgi:RNA-directed DNA polymerase
MNGNGQSDRFVVPANPLNKAAAAEAGEERKRTMGNTDSEPRSGRRAGEKEESVSSDLDRVRQVAVKDKDARFTALLHHVSVPRLLMAFEDLQSQGGAGRRRGELAGVRAGPGG